MLSSAYFGGTGMRTTSVLQNADNDKKLMFVEEVGRYMEESGSPRIAGRIIGWLLICEPPYQSFKDLVEVLGASKGSISNMTRLHLEAGLIERFTLPGDRQTYYRIRPRAWIRMLRRKMTVFDDLSRTAEGGHAFMLQEFPGKDLWRLREMRDFYRFISRKVPALIEEYEAESGIDA